jgi:SAM-dependent methyltransferase
MADLPKDVRSSYNRVAAAYAERIGDELLHKPLDRALLACFAEMVGQGGPIADIGCGPGHVTAYLAALGADACGVDLADEMVALAARAHPTIGFRQGSMLALDLPDGSLGGLLAFYAIIHLTPDELPRGLAEFHRVLRPGGLALIAFHIGNERRRIEDFFGEAVSLDFWFYTPASVAEALQNAGFTVTATLERAPYAGHEVETRRCYLLAQRAN